VLRQQASLCPGNDGKGELLLLRKHESNAKTRLVNGYDLKWGDEEQGRGEKSSLKWGSTAVSKGRNFNE